MENRPPCPEGSGAARTPARRQTFDRAAAIAELLDATVDWTARQIEWFLFGTGEAELELALARMHRAQAVVAWETAREAQAADAFPGPVYDDETIAELLAGARG